MHVQQALRPLCLVSASCLILLHHRRSRASHPVTGLAGRNGSRLQAPTTHGLADSEERGGVDESRQVDMPQEGVFALAWEFVSSKQLLLWDDHLTLSI